MINSKIESAEFKQKSSQKKNFLIFMRNKIDRFQFNKLFYFDVKTLQF